MRESVLSQARADFSPRAPPRRRPCARASAQLLDPSAKQRISTIAIVNPAKVRVNARATPQLSPSVPDRHPSVAGKGAGGHGDQHGEGRPREAADIRRAAEADAGGHLGQREREGARAPPAPALPLAARHNRSSGRAQAAGDVSFDRRRFNADDSDSDIDLSDL